MRFPLFTSLGSIRGNTSFLSATRSICGEDGEGGDCSWGVRWVWLGMWDLSIEKREVRRTTSVGGG